MKIVSCQWCGTVLDLNRIETKRNHRHTILGICPVCKETFNFKKYSKEESIIVK